jgi:ABC-type phosphate/phosphonate transport system substrate-binding protein
MIATLPMYDWPEIRDATDAWWQGIARHLGVDVPLSRPDDFMNAWSSGELLLSQTCGYPFTHGLRGRVQLVGTPHYEADGCDGPGYCSIVFAREDKPLEAFRGSTAAVNTPDSMSGMLALKLVFAPLAEEGKFFGNSILSGGHLKSLAAVRERRADVCAIDAVCVALARRYRPNDLDGLIEIARSPMVPGLPYVTASYDVVKLRAALAAAFADPALEEPRARLLVKGFGILGPQDYDIITRYEYDMNMAGGLELL